MTQSSESTNQQLLRRLAGVLPDMLSKIKASFATEKSPDEQTPKAQPTPTPQPLAKSVSWQDLWIEDTKPTLPTEEKAQKQIVFHSKIPAIELELVDNEWQLPETKSTTDEPELMNMVAIGDRLYDVLIDIEPTDVPINVSKSKKIWGMNGISNCWGSKVSDEAQRVLKSLADHRDVPTWNAEWSYVQNKELASSIAFGPLSERFDSYDEAASEASESDEIICLATNGDESESIALVYGSK